ncbi:hypothetical protein [Neomoorella humiferrea]|uniref:Uncharacterized protein n=1 Tax=Neomoorella humiferrea TaxID=676965 RepID=A0A2T0ASB7_9FIRM|nr:hypothetical protein [Moorella humiferrea]PRR73132.1 hypothetical protein MOHU_12590 [Moorella humiferrea]
MGYQAPVFLFFIVIVLYIFYRHFWRRQFIHADHSLPVLYLNGREEFLEGLLRRYIRWCYWHGYPGRMAVIGDCETRASLDILRRFFYPYPPPFLYSSGENFHEEGIFLVDIRKERDLNSAWAALCQNYFKI